MGWLGPSGKRDGSGGRGGIVLFFISNVCSYQESPGRLSIGEAGKLRGIERAPEIMVALGRPPTGLAFQRMLFSTKTDLLSPHHHICGSRKQKI